MENTAIKEQHDDGPGLIIYAYDDIEGKIKDNKPYGHGKLTSKSGDINVLDMFKLEDVPLGTCSRCKFKQTVPGSQGCWICGSPDNWACSKCKYGVTGPEIPSKSFGGCEFCAYDGVEPLQCGVYKCPRCRDLQIGQYKK